MRTMDRKIEEWVAEGLIDERQAVAIQEREQRSHPPGHLPGEGKVPLSAEAIGYIGAVLAMGAVGFFGARVWRDLDDWVQLGAIVALTAILTGAGFLLRTSTEPALRRLQSVLWLVSVGLTAAAVWQAAYNIASLDAEVTVLLMGIGAGLVALAELTASRTALQHIGVFASLGVTVGGAIAIPISGDAGWPIGVGLLGLGAIWLAVNREERLPDPILGFALAAMSMFIGSALLASGVEGMSLWVGTAVAAGLIALGVVDEEKWLTWFGAVGSLLFVPGLIFYYFGDAIGAAAAMLVIGLVLIGGAVTWSLRQARAR